MSLFFRSTGPRAEHDLQRRTFTVFMQFRKRGSYSLKRIAGKYLIARVVGGNFKSKYRRTPKSLAKTSGFKTGKTGDEFFHLADKIFQSLGGIFACLLAFRN